MSKFRLGLSIFTLIFIIGSIPIIIFDGKNSFYYFLIQIVILFFNYYLRKVEKANLLNITMIYINDCDPIRYLNEITEYNKKLYKSNDMKLMDEISKALLLLDIGKKEECREILDSLVDYEIKFNHFMKFWYYKAWIYYFDETDELEKMRLLTDKIREIAENAPEKYKSQLKANFIQIQSRYYVKAGIYLDNAEANYSEVFKGRFPKLTVVLSVYYLGVIAFKQGKFELAKERFKSVVKNAEKLYVSEKAKNLLQIIETKNANAV